ncbi:MAG: hypothetical protein GF308_03230 [Candidatus Heimdallarchaeota archaeon]|nr:hypothetical protein [Candidatus Heimdallarchaeota archaeon]
MKILHLADGPRNIRAERAGIIAKTQSNQVDLYYTGNVNQMILKKDLFKKRHFIPVSSRNNLLIDTSGFQSSLKGFINEVDPDIIHAHNIFMGKMAEKTGLPFVYDDHELWSQKVRCYQRKRIKSIVGKQLQQFLYPRWEKQLAKKSPVLVPTSGILQYYKNSYHTEEVFLFPNMPPLEEVEQLTFNEKNDNSLISVAIIAFTENPPKHKQMGGFYDLWKQNDDLGKLMVIGQKGLKNTKNIISTGRVSHYDCYTRASMGHIGIIPFKPYWAYDQFSGANKGYLYIHSGLGLITAKTQIEFKPVIEEVGYGFQFETYAELINYLRKSREQLTNIPSEKIREIARTRFILDKFGENLMNAYKLALEKH